MIKFRLSEEAKIMLSKSRPISIINKKPKGYYNSPEFYAKHPDLMPRDIYLASGRIVTKEEIEKNFNKMFQLSFKDKCKLFWNRITKNLFMDRTKPNDIGFKV